MNRLISFFLLLGLACCLTAIYGIIRNQIVYTISPDVSIRLMMENFGIIDRRLWNRAGATLVGFFGSWWMGLVMGAPILLVGLFCVKKREYVKQSLWAYAVVAVMAHFIDLILIARALLSEETDPIDKAWQMVENVYMPGLVGIIPGIVYLIFIGRRHRRHRI